MRWKGLIFSLHHLQNLWFPPKDVHLVRQHNHIFNHTLTQAHTCIVLDILILHRRFVNIWPKRMKNFSLSSFIFLTAAYLMFAYCTAAVGHIPMTVCFLYSCIWLKCRLPDSVFTSLKLKTWYENVQTHLRDFQQFLGTKCLVSVCLSKLL